MFNLKRLHHSSLLWGGFLHIDVLKFLSSVIFIDFDKKYYRRDIGFDLK